MDKTTKIILIAGIAAIVIVGATMFFTGRVTKGNQLQGSISDVIDDVKGITKQMESGIIILNTAVNDIRTNSKELTGITGSIDKFKTDFSNRMDGIEKDISGKFGNLDKSINRSIELNEQNRKQLESALGSATEMDKYIERITGYIKSVDEGTTKTDN